MIKCTCLYYISHLSDNCRVMTRNETIENFKLFLSENKDKFQDKIINIEDLPLDDDWILEDEWDEEYAKKLQKGSDV